MDLASLGMLDELIYHGFRPLPDGTVQRNPFKDPTDWQLRSNFDQRKAQLVEIQQAHPDLKIRFGVIGNEEEFGPVAADPAKRESFINQLIDICKEGQFIGVDLDYEYPRSKEQEADYDDLIVEMCRAFHAEGLKVSAAISHWKLPSIEALELLDRVHLMAYDKPEGHHSAYEDAVVQVDRTLQHGVAREQLLLGLPFYGRNMTDYKKPISQADLRNEVVPFPEDQDEVGDWAINSIGTLQKKVEFARGEGLGGVMIWEVGQDVPGEATLLKEVREAADR